MGNVTTKQVGNFQANVGKISADYSVIMSIIVAVILVIGAIIMTVIALIPRNDCPDDDDDPDCKKKHRPLVFLWGLLLIPLAILIVYLSKWWQSETRHSKTAAEVGGTMTEIALAEDLFGRH